MRMMVLALPAVALLGAGLALRSATQPVGPTADVTNPARSVAVVDRTSQSSPGFVPPTPRPRLPDPEPELQPVVDTEPTMDRETWNGPPRVHPRGAADDVVFDGPADLRIELE